MGDAWLERSLDFPTVRLPAPFRSLGGDGA